MVREEDIDTPLPSLDGLDAGEREEFGAPEQIIANIKLASIVSSILSNIYCIPRARKEQNFVRNVHAVLTRLQSFDATLQSDLKLDQNVNPYYRNRPVASLQLHFNQCIILTTRPVLFYVFKQRYKPIGARAQESNEPEQEISPLTTLLAEKCVQAARGTSHLLQELCLDGRLATHGYFDAHYLFSAVIVLMLSIAMEPTDDSDKTSAKAAQSLLTSMVREGNIPAIEYCERLEQLHHDLYSSRHHDSNRDAGANDEPDSFVMASTDNTQSLAQISSALGEVNGVSDNSATADPWDLQNILSDEAMQDFLNSPDVTDTFGRAGDFPFPTATGIDDADLIALFGHTWN